MTFGNSGKSSVDFATGTGTPVAWDGSAKTLDKGTEYTISFTPDAGVTYTKTVGGTTTELTAETEGANADKIVITGTMGDTNQTIALNKVVKTLTLDKTDATNITNLQLKVGEGAYADWDGTARTLDVNTAYEIHFNPNASYKYQYKVDEGELADVPEAVAGTVTLPAGTLTENTTITLEETALSSDTEPTITVNGEEATLAVNTYAVANLPYNVDTAAVVITPPTGGEIVSIWKGAKTYGTEVTVVNNGEYTLDVGAKGAATTYIITAKAEDGTTEANYTLTLEAAAASTAAVLTAKDDSGITVAEDTKVVTIPTAADGVITVGTLKGLLKASEGATVKVMTDTSDDTTVQEDTATVTNSMKILVTAQAGGANKATYTIAFG